MSKIIGVTVGTPISPRKIEEKLKPVKTVNGVAPDENGNVAVATSAPLGMVHVTHNEGANFYCEKTYGWVQENILEGMPVMGIFTNTATGVTEQIHAELHDQDGEIWFNSANGSYIFYADESWEYDAIPASVEATVTAIDFSNFDNGSFTETVDGEVITHSVEFDESGRPVKIDNTSIVWGDS